ncbi:CLUMA_CG021023, isoform A [Clunio marinus]|uniref:CLUMA_CG021023, isoform A n=1 Tax=Clunio marinus TaxID=568069 RepID=A0A1J1J939_9DIPT|nr:CLUMA_CG021023, isoform A [Clunio marinus]
MIRLLRFFSTFVIVTTVKCIDSVSTYMDEFNNHHTKHMMLFEGHHQRHYHMHFDNHFIYGHNGIQGPEVKHGHHFYGRHKRKHHEMDHEFEPIHWPIKKEAVVEGHVILGGLMMVHEREDNMTCGPIMPQGGIQALEAMLYTLDKINEMKLLNNITLGAHILDDCDKDTYGLEMAVDFIRVNFNHDIRKFTYGLITNHTLANRNENPLLKIVKRLNSPPSLKYDESIHWPIKKEAVVEGHVILGGLMMVHEREDNMTCGPIMPQGGIQALEAMLYTLDKINEMKLLNNITLGAHILDDCDKDTYGLEMAVDFIKGSISNIDGDECSCSKTHVRKVISGVVGAASSVTSIQVANLLRLFRIPQVSFFSTSPELSNKQRFEYFSRTIPSDHYQVKAMVEIVMRMGWSYISIIYEESNYGVKAFEELEELLGEHNICIAVKEKLVKDSGVAQERAYDTIVQKLLTKSRARGAIIFGSDQEVAGVMRAIRRNNATGVFSWIGSDGWSARNLVSDGNEPEVEGTLSVQPQANSVRGFEDYFLDLTVENNERNPWFVEFWEAHFECKYPNSSLTPFNKKYKRACTKNEKLTRNNTDFEDQLQFVSDAVMAFGYALRDMHQELCEGKPGLCEAMRPTKGSELLKYLRNVKFLGLTGDEFNFDPNGDGPARYNIIHFKQVEKGKYQWVKVGEYKHGRLHLSMNDIQFKFKQPKPPESVCSLPCDRGQAKKYVEGESCCWHCFNCTTYQIRNPNDETQCIMCPWGTLPDVVKEKCDDIPEVYLQADSWWAIGAMTFGLFGICITIFVIGIFLRNNDTPVVRASGRELSYVLLAGILMCYLETFSLVLKPTNFVCGLQRFGAGFCFTVVYAALLTKTNRIARIFKASKQSAKRPSFISPQSQLIICSALISIQILINVVWMIIAPSNAKHHYPTREDNLLVCDSYIDASYMIAFFFPIVLIIVCTVYAVLTRKIPEAFNESKHIGFTMYTTCVIWLAFVPLYFATANHVPLRITSMSVTISLSALVCMACLFTPKLYIILIRPERNVRQSMMTANRCKGLSKPPTTGSTSMMSTVMVTVTTCNQKEKIQRHMSIVEAKGSQFSDNASVNNNNNNHSLNNNTMKYSDKSTQTAECNECEASMKLTLRNEKLKAVETQTESTNLCSENICCLNSIPYADMTNSPPQPPSIPFRRLNDGKVIDNCNDNNHHEKNRIELNQLSARDLQNSLNINSGVTKKTSLLSKRSVLCDNCEHDDESKYKISKTFSNCCLILEKFENAILLDIKVRKIKKSFKLNHLLLSYLKLCLNIKDLLKITLICFCKKN